MNSNPSIPLVDLGAQYESIKEEVLAAITDVVESRKFIQGPYVQSFEEEFAKSHRASYAIGCSSGTSAISLLLEALGVGAGDEVITSTHTFFATAEAIIHVGAKPVLVDIDPTTYTIDTNQVRAAITSKTKAIVPVHIYGNLCDMAELQEISTKHSIPLVEDAAQAPFAKQGDKYAGTFGQGATFSFYPGKNLGAYGDAGLMFARDEELALKVRKLRDHGRTEKYIHDEIGYNHRMDGIQGAILSVKLKYMEEWTKLRRARANQYRSLLDTSKVTLMKETKGTEPSYHLFVISCENRDEVQTALKTAGISSGIHYPVPVHMQPAMESFGYRKGMFPISEQKAQSILSLPIFPELSIENVERITQIVNRVATSQ